MKSAYVEFEKLLKVIPLSHVRYFDEKKFNEASREASTSHLKHFSKVSFILHRY